MKNNNVDNVDSTITRSLTPFEQHAENQLKQAQYMQLVLETVKLVEGLESLQALEGETQALLDNFADEAIIMLATEMEQDHGVSA